ncbi:hypothetical protein H5410_013380 [Solanum commersonii]|uniref:Uncharacterized protein n=1 Tax=Solanum commersonii TaxID=4109 RepID=A0A9J6AV95_SOLCO|nr:hypothetical protein H5410_013380 [Solanum commersonii]
MVIVEKKIVYTMCVNNVYVVCVKCEYNLCIDAKYHRERYATILWHYGKTKNEDGAISESEVTDMVASKFGGPRIIKEHISDATNYPTPISTTRKLK